MAGRMHAIGYANSDCTIEGIGAVCRGRMAQMMGVEFNSGLDTNCLWSRSTFFSTYYR